MALLLVAFVLQQTSDLSMCNKSKGGDVENRCGGNVTVKRLRGVLYGEVGCDKGVRGNVRFGRRMEGAKKVKIFVYGLNFWILSTRTHHQNIYS